MVKPQKYASQTADLGFEMLDGSTKGWVNLSGFRVWADSLLFSIFICMCIFFFIIISFIIWVLYGIKNPLSI